MSPLLEFVEQGGQIRGGLALGGGGHVTHGGKRKGGSCEATPGMEQLNPGRGSLPADGDGVHAGGRYTRIICGRAAAAYWLRERCDWVMTWRRCCWRMKTYSTDMTVASLR